MTKISPAISKGISSVSKTFAKKDIHHWADFLEIICLFNKDNIVSQNDLIDRLTPLRDLEDGEDFKEKSNSKRNEKNSQLAEDVFSLISYRQGVFKENYPFRVSEDLKSISRVANVSDSHKLYLSLLFSSSLSIFSDFTNKLTSSFERLSLEALKKILPKNGKAFLFGSSNVESMEEGKVSNARLFEKLTKLANDIKEQVRVKEEELSDLNRGDGGLDLYAWIDLGDDNKNFPIYFCQCACTPNWVEKQHSSKYDSWDYMISLAIYPLNLIFVPYSIRKANGMWHDAFDIKKSVMMDRQRLIHILKDEDISFQNFDSYEIVNKLILQKESLV
ncbi:hypothetical protein [Pedobacter frigiditerrae]|uniref:hypothetical protein n=1 Tax=Pedobacter frigiditerrae TaxID=2530452 RepID=UPI0029301DCF|nr:hypothetical protein [Pedobacter frigiditerrae]